MKIKLADVARYLGVSNATVSLAVHDRPGVSEETRRQILECIEYMKANGGRLPLPEPVKEGSGLLSWQKRFEEGMEADAAGKMGDPRRWMLKVVFWDNDKKMIRDPQLELWSGVLETMDTEARKRGWLYSFCCMKKDEASREQIIAECNMEMVIGVIILGSEMDPEDEALLERFHKPLVIYDYDSSQRKYCSICIDNAGAVEEAVAMLEQAGARDICYLGSNVDIYNLQTRKEAFRTRLLGQGRACDAQKRLLCFNGGIQEDMEEISAWLDENELPDAFLFENYRIAVSAIIALQKKRIKAPQQILLAGIDEVPDYMVSGMELIFIKIPFRERARMCVELLDQLTGDFPGMRTRMFFRGEIRRTE